MALSLNNNDRPIETEVGAGPVPNFITDYKPDKIFKDDDINFDTKKLIIDNPFDTKEPHLPTFNINDVFKPHVSGNLDIDLPETNNGNGNNGNGNNDNNGNGNNTTYPNNSKEPPMTVDEVYGESNNQPVVEKQGDYSVSSNEKSNVGTSTFGKQDEISVTPTSVTESKGMVGNGAIQSVEGLDFQQKDKASVDVLDSKKKRDEVEAEDKADSMRNKLKTNVNNAKQEEGGEDFRIGTSEAEKAFNKENAKRQNNLNKLKQGLDETNKTLEETKNAKLEADKRVEKAELDYQNALETKEKADAAMQNVISNIEDILANPIAVLLSKTNASGFKTVRNKIAGLAETYGVEIGDISKANARELKSISNKIFNVMADGFNQDLETAKNELASAQEQQKNLETKQNTLTGKSKELESKYNKEYKEYNTWKTEAWSNAQESNKPQAQESNKPQAQKSYESAMNAIKNSVDATPEQKAQAEEVLANLEESRKALEAAAAKTRSGDPADMVAYQEALETYNKNLKDAQKIGNRWTQTDFNKDYTKAVAQSNDFRVTLADGTEMDFSDFSAEEVTKSPQYAKAMYEKEASELEEKHPILAKIERLKAKMSQTWLGSKLTFADNKVRNQFTQMAKTDMRATYAAYNNVLNDQNATPEQKAEASAAINQAKALMTASVALQATTGFMSSIGDSIDDGTFGTTDPEARNAWQKTLNTVDNFIKITLGLGISPAANKAYQNMYYIAGDKVNNSLLFNKDFDGDGFALCQEYGNNAATGMIAGAGELAVGVAMMFNPASMTSGLDLIIDSVSTFLNGLYGVRNEAEKSLQYTQEVLEYFKEAENIAESSGNEEAVQEITKAITQIENFELKADEVGNLDNWLEGSGSNTASNEKFNQSLTYDEWLKLIEADPTMREFAKSITKKKDKNAQKDNADAGLNS